MESNESTEKQEKQKYLREHIPVDFYEDFADFCQTQAGSLDINNWSFPYLQELVQKFYEERNNQSNTHERSFAIYQTTSGEGLNLARIQIPENNEKVLEDEEEKNEDKQNGGNKDINSINHNEEMNFKKKGKELQILQTQKEKEVKSSAVELLDEVFEQFDQEKKSKMEETTSKVAKSFFDSVNFWDVPKVEEKVEKKNVERGSEVQPYNYDMEASFENGFNTSNQKIQPTYVTEKQFTTFSHITNEQMKKFQSEKQKNQGRKRKKTTIKLKEVKNLESSGQLSKKKKKYQPKIPYEGTTLIKNPFSDKVSCFKSAIRPTLSDPKFSIQICDFEVIHRNFFVSDYIMYHVRVEPSGHICKRNYEDFSKLKNSLIKVYPGIQLPYLEKDSWLSDTSPEFAKKQSEVLEYFLNDILTHKQLKNSRIMQDFLSFPDHKKIKRKFEQYAKMQKLKCIQQLCLLSGDIDIKITEDQRIYGEKMTKFMEKMQYNFDRYRKYCQNVSYHYQNTMTTFSNMIDLMKEMEEDVVSFNKRVNINEIYNLDDTFKTIGDSCREQYMRMKFEKKILDQKILPFIKYERENIHCSKEIVDLCTFMTNRYLKRVDHQSIPTKSTSYLSTANKQFKNGVLDQSKNLLVYQYQVGYVNGQMSSESQRIFEELSKKVNKRWKLVAEDYLQHFAKSVNYWTTVI